MVCIQETILPSLAFLRRNTANTNQIRIASEYFQVVGDAVERLAAVSCVMYP